jgi:hypothetical protein
MPARERPIPDIGGDRMTGRTTPPDAAPPHDHETGLRTEELDPAGQFLLWGMRSWLLAFRQDSSPRGQDRPSAYRGIAGEGFLRAGVPQAMELIDDIFSALAAAALREIDVRCPRCAFVSPDEALLLGAVAASQRKQHGISWSALTQLLPPTAARAALPSLISLAVLLRDAELTLQPLDADKCGTPDLRIALGQSAAIAPVH